MVAGYGSAPGGGAEDGPGHRNDAGRRVVAGPAPGQRRSARLREGGAPLGRVGAISAIER